MGTEEKCKFTDSTPLFEPRTRLNSQGSTLFLFCSYPAVQYRWHCVMGYPPLTYPLPSPSCYRVPNSSYGRFQGEQSDAPALLQLAIAGCSPGTGCAPQAGGERVRSSVLNETTSADGRLQVRVSTPQLRHDHRFAWNGGESGFKADRPAQRTSEVKQVVEDPQELRLVRER
jgi:hypothetical protein